jgi:perosamine synthetase
MLVQGAEVARFEDALAARTDRSHAIAVSSGTAALELALESLGIGPGDDVLCPALTWPSPAHAVRRRGANVVLVDVNPHTWNVTAEGLHRARTPRTRAAILIDQFGSPADAIAIRAVLESVAIVEDAACAIGSRFEDGSPCGSLGDLSCLSFHPRKVLTTGEGGACLTDDADLARHLRMLRNHGQKGPGIFSESGPNQRLTEMAAALGRGQLHRLDAAIARRRAILARYREELPELSFQQVLPEAFENAQTAGAVLPAGATAGDRNAFLERLRAFEIEAGILSHSLGRLPSVVGASPRAMPISDDLADRGFALPLHDGLREEEVDRVVDAVRRSRR